MGTANMNIKTLVIISLTMISQTFYGVAHAAKLWSNSESFLGPGEFHGPGAFPVVQPMFEITELRNLAFFTDVDFVTPFVNNGPAEPNNCAEKEFRGEIDGKLSNGIRINENADICSATIAGTRVLVAVIEGGPHNGQQYNVTLSDGNIVMTMDLGLDLGIGEKGVIKLPFYGTTGKLEIPESLQTLQGGTGVDQAGKYVSGTTLEGRIGDFNNDGWIDGTLVAVGTMPLDSPIYPGQPYAMHRNFETNIPIAGTLYGNVKKLNERNKNSSSHH